MPFNKFHSSCPVAKRTTETFVEWTTIGGKRQRFEFQREIVWLHESESTFRFIHGGEVVREGSTWNDFYGYLSSSDPRDAKISATKYGVDASSSLEIVVLTNVFLLPAIETEECAENNRIKPENHKSMWVHVPDDWRREVVEDGETLWPTLSKVELGQEVTWSSKKSDAENLQTRETFLVKWRREIGQEFPFPIYAVSAVKN